MSVSGHYRICRVPVFAGAPWSLVRSLALALCLVGCSSGINITDNDGGISRREDETVTQITPRGDPAFSLLAQTADLLTYERRGDRPNVGVIGTDGRNDWLIRPEGGAHALSWSANSARILISTPEPPYRLYTTRPDDTGHVEIATSERPIDAAWSADESRIAYTVAVTPDASPQLVLADATGQNVRQLTHDPRSKSLPSWSADDAMISFVGFDVSGGGFYSVSILVLDDPGLEVVDLAREASLFEDFVPFTRPTWASFAPIVAFSVLKSSTLARIDFVDTRDGVRRQVTDGSFGDILLDWSPGRGFVSFARHIEMSWFS